MRAGVASLLLLAFLFPLSGRGEGVDQIVAVVGRDAITQTELDSQLLLYQAQLGLGPSETEEAEKLRKEILQTMIENRILLTQAEKETLEVKRDEIESALENAIRGMRARFASEEEFRAQLEKENTTLEGLRGRHREEVRRSLLVQKLIQKRLTPKVSVTHLDVERFYNENPDSIPTEPAAVRLSHILILILPSEGVEEAAQRKVQEILSALDAGVSFSHLARARSDDLVTRSNGGDLGYFGRGEMVPEFEEAAFSLKVGQIAAARSRFGYHVIRCEDIREGDVRVRHILVKVAPSKGDTLRAERVANEAKGRAATGEDFSSLVSEYSQDPSTKEKGGELGIFAPEELPPPFREAVKDLGAGQVAGPTLSEFGYHVVKVMERKEARTPSLDEIRDRLKAYLTQREMEKEYRKWIEQLREEIYVENRLN